VVRTALVSALALAASLVALTSARAATHVCAPRSIGPGALVRGSTTGAECMLHAFRNGCAPSTYVLSSFGVDTIATLEFALVRRNGACTISVTRSFRVVPQKPRVTGFGRCAALAKSPAGGIVATGCKGNGLSQTTSLLR
jgi:hypothetical protein